MSELSDSLASDLNAAQDATFAALCDSFNTPAVMTVISDLISKYNSADKMQTTTSAIQAVAQWVTNMVNIFGLNGSAKSSEAEIGWSGIEIPEAAKQYLQPLSSLRDELRSVVKSSKDISAGQVQSILKDKRFKMDVGANPDGEPFYRVLESFRQKLAGLKDSPSLTKEILRLCDTVRDTDLWDLGIYLEDRDRRPALVRRVTRDLVAARQENLQREQQKQRAKEVRDRDAAEKAEKGRLSHLEMFRTSEYSAWDDEGLPIKDVEGVEITKSKAKKLRKDWERQKKLHEAWVRTGEGSVR